DGARAHYQHCLSSDRAASGHRLSHFQARFRRNLPGRSPRLDVPGSGRLPRTDWHHLGFAHSEDRVLAAAPRPRVQKVENTMVEWMWIGTVSAASFLLVFALLLWVNSQREHKRKHLSSVADGNAYDDPPPELILGDMTPMLAHQLPILSGEKRKQIHAELKQA